MTTENQLKKMDRELWEMTRKLTGMHVPYNPPPKNLKIMQENNPKGYALLMLYLEKLEEYTRMTDGETQGSPEDNC